MPEVTTTAPAPRSSALAMASFLSAARRRGVTGPVVALAWMMAAYVVVFGRLTWAQHANFGTFGFDMGIFDQGIWLLSRFEEPFVTIRGLNYFGNHVNLLTVLFVPFYWLGAGPGFLYIAQTLALAAGAIPLWLLGRDKLRSPWLALVAPAAYLLHPSIEWINWWHFHPDALAVTPLLFAWWLATRQRWGWYAVAVAVALSAKEDVSMAVAMMGLLIAWRHRRDRRGRTVGLGTVAAGVGWFFLATKVIIPLANGGGEPFYDEFFPQFAGGTLGIAGHLVAHPSWLWEMGLEHDRLTYYEKLFAPVAFLPIGSPVSLIGLPHLVVNVISGHSLTREIKYQYSAVIDAAMFLGAIEACAWWGRNRAVRAALLTALALAAVVGNVLWSPSPLGRDYDSGIWSKPTARHAVVREALSLVPGDAGVSATYYIAPHLTHRVHAYEWPNPFEQVYWGLRGENPPDVRLAEYLVLDLQLLGEKRALYDRLVATDYAVLFEEQDIVVARRQERPRNAAAPD